MTRKDEQREPGLTRQGLVTAALQLVQQEGLEALSMRALAEALGVKASSLYWHVRDRRELLELLAESILETVRRTNARVGWRPAVVDLGAALGDRVLAQRDAARILLEVPEALDSSRVFSDLKAALESSGLRDAEAAEVARLVMLHVITARTPADHPLVSAGAPAKIAIDSGSRGVLLRDGVGMQTLFRVAHDRTSAAPAVVRGETVIVRRLRGVGVGEIELNPRHPWRFQIQGPTWNTVLDVGAIDVREIKLDSGAAKVECFLPKPRDVVPIIVSGGVVGLNLHRPPGVAVVADISPGVLRVKLDGFSARAVVSDLHWESEGAAASSDRYELLIQGGAVQVSLDEREGKEPQMQAGPTPEPLPYGKSAAVLDILLDGVEARVRSRR